MKHVLLFFLSICIGIMLAIGYRIWFISTDTISINTFKKPVYATTKFSLEKAPSNSLNGNIASISGNVQWLSRTAVQPTQLTIPHVIQQGEEVITGDDGKVIIQFPSVATVSALQNTFINIVQTLPANIVIQQDSGTAYYTSYGIYPISIRSFDLITTINKGIVTITVDKNIQRVTTTVEKGTATEGFNDTQNVSNVVTVGEGDQFIFNNVTKQGITQ